MRGTVQRKGKEDMEAAWTWEGEGRAGAWGSCHGPGQAGLSWEGRGKVNVGPEL